MFAQWMQSFVSVADAGSFSVAAQRLALTQSTVSKRIAALEAHLSTRLFNRTTRSLVLTDEGSAFYEAARRALDALDEAHAVLAPTTQAQGLLRVTMPLTLAEARIVPLISRFAAEHPQIQFDLSLSDHALNLVADNIDVAIRVGRLVDSRLIARRIGTARRVMVASPAYLDRHGRPQSIEDLAAHNCLLYSLSSAGTRWHFVGGAAVSVAGTLRADSPNALRAAVLADMGIAINAHWLFEHDLASGALEIVAGAFEPEPMPIYAVLPSGRHLAARTRLFVDYLAASVARDPLCA